VYMHVYTARWKKVWIIRKPINIILRTMEKWKTNYVR
jgi:hypothetical protein